LGISGSQFDWAIDEYERIQSKKRIQAAHHDESDEEMETDTNKRAGPPVPRQVSSQALESPDCENGLSQ